MANERDHPIDETALLAALGKIVRQNPRVSDALRVLATEFLGYLNETGAPQNGEAAPAAPAVAPVAPVVPAAPPAPPATEVQRLHLAGSVVEVRAITEPGLPKQPEWQKAGFAGPVVVEDAPEPAADEPDLKLIAKRSHLRPIDHSEAGISPLQIGKSRANTLLIT